MNNEHSQATDITDRPPPLLGWKRVVTRCSKRIVEHEQGSFEAQPVRPFVRVV